MAETVELRCGRCGLTRKDHTGGVHWSEAHAFVSPKPMSDETTAKVLRGDKIPDVVTLWSCPGCGFTHPLAFWKAHPIYRVMTDLASTKRALCGTEPVQVEYRRSR